VSTVGSLVSKPAILEVLPVRVFGAFSCLLRLEGVYVRDVDFEPDRVIVEVALRRPRLVCPLCSFSTPYRHDVRPVLSEWRHLDLGVWRLEVCARLRRVACPHHGVRVEGVPFARHRSGFTRDFEGLVAWLATRTDKTTIKRMVCIDWDKRRADHRARLRRRAGPRPARAPVLTSGSTRFRRANSIVT
jgi:transposase